MVDHNNPFAGNAFSNPAAREVLSGLSAAGAKAALAGNATPSKHITPDQINGFTIVNTLNGDFVRSYLSKLEEAKSILKVYRDRLGDFTRRLEKGDVVTRKVLGEDILVSKIKALDETIDKINVHELKTIERLVNGK